MKLKFPKKDIDWLNHALEFLVVVVGILLAFQLNTCSDNNRTNELIDSHLNYIDLECEENINRLAEYVDHTKGQLRACDSLIQELNSSKEVNRIRSLSVRLLDLRNVDLIRDAYSVLSTSGDIRYLSDFDKKRKIITLYDTFEQIERVNLNCQKLYDNHFYPYLQQNFDLVNWGYLDIRDQDNLNAYSSNEFANVISTYRFLLSSKLTVYKNEQDLLADYLAE